ncbi:cobalamin biosynthesis protein [Coprothermobacteraceae bacterium]|nr:cobalamin biosynthesis protein [Coprothermobacteraceae bacterium]
MWILLLVLIVLSPLGLLAEGEAWGEWALEEIGKMTGFVPSGAQRFAEWFHALLPDYTFPALGDSFWAQAVGYILSAVIGVGAIFLITFLLLRGDRGKVLRKDH